MFRQLPVSITALCSDFKYEKKIFMKSFCLLFAFKW